MSSGLYELLASSPPGPTLLPFPPANDPLSTKYLDRLTTLPLSAFTSSEPQSLSTALHSADLTIQSLASRSSKSLISSSASLSQITPILRTLQADTLALRPSTSTLDSKALAFAEKYTRISENEVLDRRKECLLLQRNAERVSDVLDLPSLLSSTIASAASQGPTSQASYNAALDLYSHIRQLSLLYPESNVVKSIRQTADAKIQEMASTLMASLSAQSLKLSSAIRTIGWLRRIMPEMNGQYDCAGPSGREGTLGLLFLGSRLQNLLRMLDALTPLRELADQETNRRQGGGGGNPGERGRQSQTFAQSGAQTERYLKRYIEIFREQSFAIISTFKSIFPSDSDEDSVVALSGNGGSKRALSGNGNPFHPMPSALATFPLHICDILLDTLRRYMPNVTETSSRESLYTQVLYCAASLGRLGADFGMMLAFMDDDVDEDNDNDNEGMKSTNDEDTTGEEGEEKKEQEPPEWVRMMKMHRVQASRLEVLAAGGAKTGKTLAVR